MRTKKESEDIAERLMSLLEFQSEENKTQWQKTNRTLELLALAQTKTAEQIQNLVVQVKVGEQRHSEIDKHFERIAQESRDLSAYKESISDSLMDLSKLTNGLSIEQVFLKSRWAKQDKVWTGVVASLIIAILLTTIGLK